MKTQNFDFRIWNTEEKKYIDRNGYVQKYNVDNYFVVLVKDSFQILKIRDMTKEMNIDSENYWMAEYSTIKDVTNICEIELFTGITDKNGNNVYEGDIVKFNYKGKEYIEVVELTFYQGIFFGELKLTDIASDSLILQLKEFEVIGNINENKRLLKRKIK